VDEVAWESVPVPAYLDGDTVVGFVEHMRRAIDNAHLNDDQRSAAYNAVRTLTDTTRHLELAEPSLKAETYHYLAMSFASSNGANLNLVKDGSFGIDLRKDLQVLRGEEWGDPEPHKVNQYGLSVPDGDVRPQSRYRAPVLNAEQVDKFVTPLTRRLDDLEGAYERTRSEARRRGVTPPESNAESLRRARERVEWIAGKAMPPGGDPKDYRVISPEASRQLIHRTTVVSMDIRNFVMKGTVGRDFDAAVAKATGSAVSVRPPVVQDLGSLSPSARSWQQSPFTQLPEASPFQAHAAERRADAEQSTPTIMLSPPPTAPAQTRPGGRETGFLHPSEAGERGRQIAQALRDGVRSFSLGRSSAAGLRSRSLPPPMSTASRRGSPGSSTPPAQHRAATSPAPSR